MDHKIAEFVKEWITIAEDDLRWAKASFDAGFYSRACFVCQQIAEKSLKGYLYGSKIQEKTHSLLRLMDLCIKVNSKFGQLKNNLVVLDPYYISTRYPDIGDIERFESKELASQALVSAEKVFEFVKREVSSS